MRPTTNFETAARRLAEAMDYEIVKEGRKLRPIPPDYAMEGYERAGLGHEPCLPKSAVEVLGAFIVGLSSEPHYLSYKEIWSLCKLDAILFPKGGWWIQEIEIMVKAGRGY